MSESDPPVEIALRIPGTWSHPKELIEKLPTGCRLDGESLFLPDGTQIGFGALQADGQFAQIFRSSCRQPATDEEFAAVDNYSVNVVLYGPGGSLDAARTMMHAAAAILRAGGAGVFIDNSTVAHGATNWLDMAEDGSPDALSFAYVAIVSGKSDVWTMGMHILGLRDVIMKHVDAKGFDIIEVLRYMCRSDKPIDDGHVLANLDGPRLQAFAEDGDARFAGSPMHNPFGRLRLVSLRDVAESN